MKKFFQTVTLMLSTLSILTSCADNLTDSTGGIKTVSTGSLALNSTQVTTLTDDASLQPSEPQIGWHPEVLWTPLSLNAEEACLKLSANEKGVAIGKYGIYGENGLRNEIADDQRIAFAMYVDTFIEFIEAYEYYEGDSEFQALFPDEELYEHYREKGGGYAAYPLFEDLLEKEGYEVVKDHARHYTRFQTHSSLGDPKEFHYPPQILIFATEEEIASLKSPIKKAEFHIYGASVEDFAPSEG